MSAGAGRREVAVRCFAAEYEDADYEYSESDEERAPNYVVTPTGARVNRLFVVGVLTEVEPVSDDVLRARIVDPTGAFVVYAGQYQPDAKTFLERAEPPAFVAVTGKARTFEPDDGDVVYTSVRPESITEVDADTRDRWTVQAAQQTLDRVATTAAALSRAERGDALREVLLAAGVDERLAAGVPRAIDHYGTTEAYLAAVRDLAIEAAEVVAGERDEVGSLSVEPGEGGPVEVDLAGDVDLSEIDAVGEPPVDAPTETAETTAATDNTTAEEGPATAEADTAAPSSAEEATSETTEAPAAPESTTAEPEADATAEVDPDDHYELDAEERAEIEEEFGTEFSTGNEVGAAGEADIETPGPVDEDDDEPEEPTESTVESAQPQEAEAQSDGSTADEAEVDLQDAAIEAMADLDDGDGADRQAVIETVADDHDVEASAVEDAIQEALMAGRCYESGDDRLKAI